MKNILESLFLTTIFICCYLLNYSEFYVCLRNDVDFNFGKKHFRNIRRNTKGFLKKFFFIDMKDKVNEGHYICFWINFLSFIPAIISLNCYAVYELKSSNIVLILFGSIYILTSIIASFSYYSLYRGNKVRSKKDYRK